MIIKSKYSPKDNRGQQIRIDRDSICMADDFMAPNEEYLSVSEQDRVTDVLDKAAAYLPNADGAIWAVDTGTKVLAFILKKGAYELCQDNRLFLEMGIKSLHCSYFHENSFGGGGNSPERYPECNTLLKKVKSCMKERFVEELRVKGGGLCIWGEWFGRPHDNYFTVDRVKWTKDKIAINFDSRESLYIHNPAGIINEERRLMIEDASRVLWVWHAPEKKENYISNLLVREYIKNENGEIMRAAGRREDVREGNGVPFTPLDGYAVKIGTESVL